MSSRRVEPKDGAAWVTGASSGIGYQLCLLLARKGWRVLATARSEGKLQELAAEFERAKKLIRQGGAIVPAPADTTDEAAMRAAFERAGEAGVALAIANAGIYLPVDAAAPDLEAYRKTFEVNLTGTAAMTTLVTPGMAARGKGQIVIVSSATGFGGMPTASAYGASKAGLINMAECLEIELKRHGVRAQVATPGFVDTPAQEDNEFPKPFMITPEAAARRIERGVRRSGFEITFPRRFTWGLKAVYALPYGWRQALVRRQTGWNKPAGPEE